MDGADLVGGLVLDGQIPALARLNHRHAEILIVCRDPDHFLMVEGPGFSFDG
jgi:hypothetical protein